MDKKGTIKNYFIPSEKNDHKPLFLRSKMLLSIVFLAFFIELVFFSPVSFFSFRSDYLASVLPSVLVSQTNKTRVEDNLNALTPNPILQLAAQMKANDMAAKGYFSHTTPDGRQPWYWLTQAGYAYQYAGENLAVNFMDSGDVTKAWMRSPGHRANIVNQHYTEVGIAVAPGVYKGKNTMFVVQFFGYPKTSLAQVGQQVGQTEASKLSTTIASPTKSTTPTKTQTPSKTEASKAKVLGSETETETETETAVEAAAVVLGKVKADSVFRSFRKILTEPKLVADYVFTGIILAVLIALALTIFIKIKIQHPPLIAGAVAVVVLVAGLMYFNTSMFSRGVEIPNDSVSASTIGAF